MGEDGPILYVKDSWSGNPNETAVFSAEGVKQSKDERLVERVRKQDETVKRQTGEIKVLRTELKTSKMQVKALREEARLSANVRIALKDQLKAERKREREKERTTIIYILSIDFLRCNENNHLTHI